MKFYKFDEAFKPSADDISRGDGLSTVTNLPVDYPQFGFITVLKKVVSINEYLQEQSAMFKKRYSQDIQPRTDEVCEFDYIKKLADGTFGDVAIVRQKQIGVYYARKEMFKHRLVTSKKIPKAKNERKVLDSLRYPFNVHLKYFYKDQDTINFILPLCAGGDLYTYFKRHKPIKERLAKFITAQIILGLEYLHFIGVIHRDIKLENMLIDHHGYIKISNYGMSKLINLNRTYTICGTAEFMAPEVISQKGYGLPADWWSFGALLYELCNGTTPFDAHDTIQTFHLILYGDFSMPRHFSILLQDLINNILQVDVTKRYGNLKNGINDIKNHSWFRDVPWLTVINQRIISPLVPFSSTEKVKQYFEPIKQAFLKKEDVDLYQLEFADF